MGKLKLSSKEDVQLAIRRRGNEIAAKLTDREIFLSAEFTHYTTRLADFILRKHRLYSLKLDYVDDPSGPIAYTDGKMIYLNTGNSLAKGPKLLERRFKTNMGILLHEVAHKLFLDFSTKRKALEQIEKGTLYGDFSFAMGEPTLQTAYEELEKVTASPYAQAIAQIYADMENRISDGHDERAMKNSFPGFIRECIEVFGEVQMEGAPTLEGLIADRADTYSIYSCLILQYAKFSYYKVGEHNADTDKMLDTMALLEPVIDAALEEDSLKKRWEYLNQIVLYLWPYLRERFPENPQGQSSSQGSQNGQGNSSGQGNQNSQGNSGGQNGQNGSSGNGAMTPQALAQAIQEAAQAADKAMGANPVPKNCSGNGINPKQVQGGGSTNASGGFSGTDISGIAQDIGQEEAKQQIQQELDQEQMNAIRNLNVPLVHQEIPVQVHRHNAEDESRYKQIVESVAPYTRNLVSSMKELLRELNEEYKQRHRRYGPIIESSDFYRVDKAFFSKKKMPADQPDMALCVLVDQSDSMDGRKLNSAMKTVIMLEKFASQIDIPTMIAGHGTGGKTCKMFIYTDFTSAMTNQDRYSLAAMTTHGGNRDGLALRICCELLEKRPERVKMLIIISDGAPAHYDYSGDEAMKDISDTVTSFRRKGLLIYGAAIDEDKEIIEKIYGKNFLSIQDLSKMPKTLTRLIRQQIN